jgi:tetratricopeptide (TPR) repeat protein
MIGTIDCRLGNFGSAWANFDQAQKISKATGLRIGEAFTLGNMGAALLDTGDYTAAQTHHNQALSICREIEYLEGKAFNLGMLGLVAQRLDDSEKARACYCRALAITREIGDRSWEGYLLTYLGHTLIELGVLPAAEQAFHDALQIRRELDEHSGMAVDDLAGLARCALAQGRCAEAQQYAEEALTWMDQYGTESVEYPVFVYLICYQTLRTCSIDCPARLDRAEHALQTGYDLLLHQADRIADQEIRRQYLEEVPFNAQLTQVWTQRDAYG